MTKTSVPKSTVGLLACGVAVGILGVWAPRRAPIVLFSDLLLHDMRPGLADQMQQGSAQGNEWRTMPLWRASERGRFLHDGRAVTMTDAITARGGLAQQARDLFLGLPAPDKAALLAFVNGI